MGWRVKGILIVIIILGIVLRLKGITNPYLDDQGWRQADTASMAFNMLGHLGDFPDVLFPMLNYDGVEPQPVELEFPFFPYLLAWTWTFLGWQDIWGRLWGICFSVLTIWGVYKFGKRAFSERVGLWAGAMYAFFPLTIYYGRVVMPEPVAQAFSIWALLAILAWRSSPTPARFRLAALLMSGAILAKLPQLMIFPVALVIGFYHFQGRIGKMFIYSVSAFGLPMLYYSWVHLGAGESSQFVSGILSYQVLAGDTSYAQNLIRNLSSGLGFPILMALVGTVLMVLKKPLKNPESLGLLLWAVISCVYIGVICLKIPLDYYLVPIALPIALLAGYTIDVWGGEGEGCMKKARSGKAVLTWRSDKCKRVVFGVFLMGVLVIVMLWLSQIWYDDKYHWDKGVLAQAEWIRQHTEGDSVLLLSGAPPMTLYYAQRYGYRLYSDDEQAWEDIKTLPGDYLIALPNSRGEEFWQRVGGSFPQVGPGVYLLTGVKD